MTSRFLKKAPLLRVQLALLIAFAMGAPLVRAQAPSRFVGTITAISGDTLTVKTDAGEVHQVQIPATAASEANCARTKGSEHRRYDSVQ